MASQMQYKGYLYEFISLIRSNKDVRITCISMVVNAALALGKGLGGWHFNSQTLTADGLHSLTDLFEDFLSLFAVFWSAKSRSSQTSLDFHIARLGAATIGGILLAGGAARSFHCLSMLVHFFYPVDGVDSFQRPAGSKTTQESSSLTAAWLALAFVIVKEWLYRLTLRVASETRSTVLASTAIHHRMDAITSFIALVTICGTWVLTDIEFRWLDDAGGLIVSFIMIRAGWNSVKLLWQEN